MRCIIRLLLLLSFSSVSESISAETSSGISLQYFPIPSTSIVRMNCVFRSADLFPDGIADEPISLQFESDAAYIKSSIRLDFLCFFLLLVWRLLLAGQFEDRSLAKVDK